MSKLIATWFYSGYLRPASGTWGTVAGLPLCLVVTAYFGLIGIVVTTCLLFTLGLWSAHEFEIETGEHDSSRIVIDEVAGMMIACIPLLYQFDWMIVFACFALFRVFDAWKVGLVGWCDKKINGALGVMIDDIVAGFLTTIVMLGYLLWMR
jgi:phosphatidylglycerophosphatase A